MNANAIKGSFAILCVNVNVTIGTMLKFNANVDPKSEQTFFYKVLRTFTVLRRFFFLSETEFLFLSAQACVCLSLS